MGKKSVQPWACQCGQMCGQHTLADLASAGEEVMKPALLLHSCCGPCSTSVIERLSPDYDLTVFFYNPCITDPEEYEKRKASQVAFIEQYQPAAGRPWQNLFYRGGVRAGTLPGSSVRLQ